LRLDYGIPKNRGSKITPIPPVSVIFSVAALSIILANRKIDMRRRGVFHANPRHFRAGGNPEK
jgi:hypothetical protein